MIVAVFFLLSEGKKVQLKKITSMCYSSLAGGKKSIDHILLLLQHE